MVPSLFCTATRCLMRDEEDTNVLNGDAYKLIVETVSEETGWRDRIKPLRRNGSPHFIWVFRDVSYDTSSGNVLLGA